MDNKNIYGSKKYIIALDQGTTSSRAVIFNKNTDIISSAQREYTQICGVKKISQK